MWLLNLVGSVVYHKIKEMMLATLVTIMNIDSMINDD